MLFHGIKPKRKRLRGRPLAPSAGRAWFESFGEGLERALILGSFTLVELLVSGLNELGGGAIVIRVDAHADSYADGWLGLIGAEPVLDALRDLLGHAPVRITVPGNGPAGPEGDGEAGAVSR